MGCNCGKTPTRPRPVHTGDAGRSVWRVRIPGQGDTRPMTRVEAQAVQAVSGGTIVEADK